MSNSSVSSMPHRRRKHVKEAVRKGKLLCAVCGATALGYNFDVITCDSCKVFFRRNALKSATVLNQCVTAENQCAMTPFSRKKCSACRLKCCFEAGMKSDWITPLDKLVHRANYCGRRAQSVCKSQASSSSGPVLHVAPLKLVTKDEPLLDVKEFVPSPETSQEHVPLHQRHSQPSFSLDSVTEHFTTSLYQIYYQQIETILRVLQDPLATDEIEPYLKLCEFSLEKDFNRREVAVRRIIRAFKEIPQFTLLSREAQATLVKENMQAMATLFIILRFNYFTKCAIFNYITSSGEQDWLSVDFHSILRHAILMLPQSFRLQLLERFFTSPLLPISTLAQSFLAKESDETDNEKSTSARLHSIVSVALRHIRENTGFDNVLLGAIYFLKLFRIEETSIHFPFTRCDRFVIQRTRAELEFFINCYAKQLWTEHSMISTQSSATEASGMSLQSASLTPSQTTSRATLTERLERLWSVYDLFTIWESLNAGFEMLVKKDYVSPLMREFLHDESYVKLD